MQGRTVVYTRRMLMVHRAPSVCASVSAAGSRTCGVKLPAVDGSTSGESRCALASVHNYTMYSLQYAFILLDRPPHVTGHLLKGCCSVHSGLSGAYEVCSLHLHLPLPQGVTLA